MYLFISWKKSDLCKRLHRTVYNKNLSFWNELILSPLQLYHLFQNIIKGKRILVENLKEQRLIWKFKLTVYDI